MQFRDKPLIIDCFWTVLTVSMRILPHLLLHFRVFTVGDTPQPVLTKCHFVALLYSDFDSFDHFSGYFTTFPGILRV